MSACEESRVVGGRRRVSGTSGALSRDDRMARVGYDQDEGGRPGGGTRAGIRTEDRGRGPRTEDRDGGPRTEDRDGGPRSEDRDGGPRTGMEDGGPKTRTEHDTAAILVALRASSRQPSAVTADATMGALRAWGG